MVPKYLQQALRLIHVWAGVQIPGVLDQLKFYEGPLGAEITKDAVTLRVWAPTAQSVELLLWDRPRGGEPQTLPMTEDRLGVWTVEVSNVAFPHLFCPSSFSCQLASLLPRPHLPRCFSCLFGQSSPATCL
jgi:hypothetical protein